jgi:hypothetical protein
VDDLALQVGLVHHVEVDDAKRADTRRGQVHQRRGPEPASADDQDLGVLEPPLAGLADVRDDQVPGVAPDLVHSQVVSWGNERGQRHGRSPGLSRAGFVHYPLKTQPEVPMRHSLAMTARAG